MPPTARRLRRVLVVYCHPCAESYTAAIRDAIVRELSESGVEIRLIDLYADQFDPVLSLDEWRAYLNFETNTATVSGHVDALKWADGLIFIYPTWWYGLPALLKGWLDRVFAPGVAFELSEGRDIRPTLSNVRSIDVFTTCGASWMLTRMIGNIGRRTLLRGIRLLCHRFTRTSFVAHYLMDSSTPQSRARHLERVAAHARRIARRRLAPLKG